MCSTISLALLFDAPRKTLLPLTDERDWESGLENDNENENAVCIKNCVYYNTLVNQ